MSSGQGNLVYTITLQPKGQEQISAADRLLQQLYATLQRGGQTVTQFTQGFTRGTQEVATSAQKVTQSSQQLVTSINSQKTAFQGTQQTANTYKQALDQTAQSQSRLGQQNQTLVTGLNNQKTAFTGAVGSMNQYKAATDQVYTSQGKVTQGYQQATQQVNLYKTAQQQSLATIQQTNTAMTQQATLAQTLKQNFSTLTLGVTTLTTGVFNLYNTYDSLVDTQMQLDTMQQKVDRNTKALDTAQERLNKTLKDGKATQDDIKDAYRDVEQAENRLKLSKEKLTDAQEDLDRAWKDFYINTIPAAVQTLGGGAAAIGTFATALRNTRPAAQAATTSVQQLASGAAPLAPILGGIGGRGKEAGAGLKEVGTGAGVAAVGGRGLLAVLGPIGLAIAAVGGALFAVNTNFMGFRDVLNNVGSALGDLFPPIEGTLNLIKGVAGQLGISGEAATEWQKALTLGTEKVHSDFDLLAKGIETALNEIGYAMQDTYIFFENFAQLGSIIGKGIGDAVAQLSNFAGQVKAEIDKGLAFLSDPNTWAKGWDGFVEMAGSAGANAMKLIQQKINEFGRWVFGNDQWENLVAGALDAANNSVKVIQQTLAGVSSWIDTNIIQPAAASIQKSILEPLGKSMPQADPNVRSEQDRAYFLQTIEAQKKTAFGKPLDETLKELSGTPVVPAAKQTKAEVQFGATGKPSASDYGVFGPIGKAIFSDDSRAKSDWGAKAMDLASQAGSRLAGVFQKVEAAEGQAKQGASELGAQTQKLSNEQLRAAELTQAFEAGVTKQTDALKQMQTASFETAGEVATLHKQLQEGQIQIHAFSQGYLDAAKNFLNMQVNTQKLGGEILFLSQTLGTAEGITTRFNMGFAQGAKGVLEWAGNMDTARGAAEGSKAALISVADTLGVDIPEGFRGSNEAMKQWIALTKQAGPEFEAMIQQVQQGFESMTSGLGDAIRSSNDDFNDAIDEMQEKLGIKFNEGVKNALRLEAGADAISSLSKDFTQLFSGIANNISASDFFELRNAFKDRIAETFGDIPMELRPVATKIMQDLMDALNAPVDLQDPQSVRQYIANVEKELIRLDNIGNATAETWQGNIQKINEGSDLTAATEQVDSLTRAMENLTAGFVATIEATEKFGSLEVWGGAGLGAEAGVKAGASPDGKVSGQSKGGKSTEGGQKAPAKKGGMAPPIDLAAWQATLDEAQTLFTTFMTTMFENAAAIPAGVMAGIEPMKEMFGETMIAIRDAWTGMVTLMVSDAQAISTGLIAAFEAAKEPIGETLLAIRDAATSAFTLIISDAQALGPGISAAFADARSQSQPHISGLSEDFASMAVAPIESMAEGLAETIGQAFESGASRATAALGEIESAANTASSAVAAIGQEIENLPSEKTITIRIETVGSVPSVNASGYEGVVNGPVQFTAGEAGPELVSVIPLSRQFTGPGSRKGGAAGFGNDGVTRIAAADGFTGVVGGSSANGQPGAPGLPGSGSVVVGGSANGANGAPGSVGADAATYRHGNLEGQPPNQGNAMTNVNIAAVGGRPVSSVGGILGGIPVTIVSGNSGWIPGGGPGGGFGLPGGGGGSGSGGGGGGSGSGGGGTGTGGNVQRRVDVNENGTHYYYYQNGSNIQTNMNAEQIARYVGPTAGGGTGSGGGGTPTTPPTGGGGGSGGGGSGGGTGGNDPSGGVSRWGDYDSGAIQTSGSGQIWKNPNQNPNSWQVVPMRDDPSKWKVVDDRGQNVAAGFSSEDSARGYIEDKRAGKGYNDVSSPDYVRPEDVGSGGTGPGQTTGNRPLGMEGHPNTWKIRRVEGGTFDVTNSGNVNIARGFRSQQEAVDYREAHRDAYNNNLYVGPAGPGQTIWVSDSGFEDQRYTAPNYIQLGQAGGGSSGFPPSSGSGSGSGSGEPNIPGQSGNNTTGYDFSNVQTSGGSKWTTNPQGPYEIVPMQDDPSKWKVIDSTGKNVAANFDSREQAEAYMSNYGYNLPGNQYATGSGSGGTGGTPNNPPPPTTTPPPTTPPPTTGTGIGGSYTAPGGIQTSGSGSRWQGADTRNPDSWRAVPMINDPSLWKVVDANDKNVATNFASEAAAQEYIDAHRQAKASGQWDEAPIGGGQTMNWGGGGGGTGGTPTTPPTPTPTPNNPPPNTGGGGQQQRRVQLQINDNGQQLYYDNTSGQVVTNMTPEQINRYVGPGMPGGNPVGGGGGTGGGGTGGGTGGGGGPLGPPTQVVEAGDTRIEQYANGQRIYMKGKLVLDTTPGGGGPFPGGGMPPGFPGGGLFGGFGLPYGPISPRVSTDVSIPSGFMGFSGSGYIGNEPGAGGVGRPPWTSVTPGSGFPWGNWPFGGIGTGGTTTGNPNIGETVNVGNGIKQTQTWSQTSNIVSGGSIVGRGNNINIQRQYNGRSNVGGGGGGMFPWPFPGGGGTGGGPSGGGNALAGGQYYDSWVVENADKTERHPEFRTNMNQAQMSRLLAMMAASGQEVPYYTSGEPAITGFRYNGSGWLGSRPIPTARQLRTGRDNTEPIWDTGRVTMPSDFGTMRGPNMGVTGNIGGRNPFDWLGGLGNLIDKLTENILGALQAALGKMAININLNNTSIGDAQTRLMMRRIGTQF